MINRLEQVKDEIGVILEVDLTKFFDVFSLISYVNINILIRLKNRQFHIMTIE